MITTICLNPCFDKTVEVDQLDVGRVNRIRDARVDLGGKGINVAVVAHRLGLDAQCIGTMGENGAEELCRLMEKTNGRDLLNRPRRALLLDETNADTWAHNLDTLGGECGVFGEPVFSVTERGPVRATLRITQRFASSVISSQL